MNLTLSYRQELPYFVREELDRLVASINAQWEQQHDVTTGLILDGSITVDQLNFAAVDSESIVATINASTEGLRISGAKIQIDGAVTFASGYDPTGKIATGGAASDINGNATTVNGGKLTANTVVASKIAALSGGSNRVKNSGFEDAVPLSGWSAWNGGGEATGTGSTTTAPYEGANAFYISWDNSTAPKGLVCTAGGNHKAWQPNQQYVLSFYAKATSAMALGMGTHWNDIYPTIETIANPNLTTAWQRYAFRLTWGATVETGGRFQLTIASPYTTGANTLFIDAIKVESGELLGAYVPAVDEIPPGTILTEHLAAGCVTADKITVDDEITVGTGGVIRSGATELDYGVGWWMDYNAGTPRFRLGDPNGNQLLWDGTNLSIGQGTVTINEKGLILKIEDGDVGDSANACTWSGSQDTGIIQVGAGESGALASDKTRTLYIYNTGCTGSWASTVDVQGGRGADGLGILYVGKRAGEYLTTQGAITSYAALWAQHGDFELDGDLEVTGSTTLAGGAVSYGANDSAGTGYRTVRVPNA